MSKGPVSFVRMAVLALLGILYVTCASRALIAEARVGPTATIGIVGNGELAAAIVRARDGAGRSLDRDACTQVFTQFSDAHGRSLDDVLAARGASAADSLGRLVFRDGDAAPACRMGPVAAFTSGVVPSST